MEASSIALMINQFMMQRQAHYRRFPMNGRRQAMRTQIYDHRSGLKVVPNDIVADVKNIIWNINPALSKKTVSSLKESVRERLEKEGWTGEYRLDATSRITISSYLRGVGLCFQTGNVGRIYADLLKLQRLGYIIDMTIQNFHRRYFKTSYLPLDSPVTS